MTSFQLAEHVPFLPRRKKKTHLTPLPLAHNEKKMCIYLSSPLHLTYLHTHTRSSYIHITTIMLLAEIETNITYALLFHKIIQ